MTPQREQQVRTQIVAILQSYPYLTSTMISLYVRPYEREWRRVLEDMVTAGEVVIFRTPGRMANAYAIPSQLKRLGWTIKATGNE